MVDFYGKWLGKYTSPMDPMGREAPFGLENYVKFAYRTPTFRIVQKTDNPGTPNNQFF